jgi:predicted nucleic acid-binding protein
VERRQAPRVGASREGSRGVHLRYGDRGSALTLYLDTSALLKLHVEEDGSGLVRDRVRTADCVSTSEIAYVEARAAFARRRRAGDLSLSDYRRIAHDFEADWERYLRLDVTIALIRSAAAVAETHRLRAYDAIHLASAMLLRTRWSEPVTFGSWDQPLDGAAAREGFALIRGR